MKTFLVLVAVLGIANAVNVALRKPTSQSSTSSSGSSSRAVDGHTNSDYSRNTCTHTTSQNHAMWYVDLGKQYNVSQVEIFNRADCCSDRLKLFEIIVGNKKPVNRFHRYHQSEICVDQPQTFKGSKKFQCPGGMVGRYVVIRFYDQVARPLTLCEVKVEGTEPIKVIEEAVYLASDANVALKKPTSQSSTSSAGSSSRGVDGNTNMNYFDGNSCTHTVSESQAMWSVDLGKKYSVSHVEIFNRADCCSHRLKLFEIIVSNKKPEHRHRIYPSSDVCAKQAKTFKGSKRFQCPGGMVGRYVVIRFYDHEARPLTLCEVKVEGTEAVEASYYQVQRSRNAAFCHRENSDCLGHDKATIKGRSLQQCQQACNERTDCMSIQYYSGTDCYLKDHVCTNKELRKNSKANDYVLVDNLELCPVAFKFTYCLREKVMCPGGTITTIDGLNRAQCQMHCSTTTRCRSVQHRSTTCVLKDFACADFEIMGDAASNDYVRVSDTAECKYLYQIYD